MNKESTPDLPPGTWVWLHDFGRSRLFPWLWAVLVRRHVYGRERIPKDGPVVLVANHSSLLDGPIIVSVLGRRPVFLIKRELFVGPLGAVLTRLGQLAVRRGTPDRAPLLAAVRVLNGGGLIGVFPEGTRGSGEVVAAHNGAAWLARAGNAVILPVACRGTRRPPGTKHRWRPRVDVLIGDPLPTPAAKGRTALAEATEQTRSALANLVTELDRRRGSDHIDERKVKHK